jgi:hypothetical protein
MRVTAWGETEKPGMVGSVELEQARLAASASAPRLAEPDPNPYRNNRLDLLSRGIWTAPWLGPVGEPVLLVVTSEAKLLLPPEAVPVAQLDSRQDFLWELLDAMDPESSRSTADRRRRTLKAL